MVTDTVTLEIRIDQGDWQNIPISSGTWTYTLDPESLEPGSHTLTLRAYDGEEYTSQTVQFTIEGGPLDSFLPILLILSLAAVVIVGLLFRRKK